MSVPVRTQPRWTAPPSLRRRACIATALARPLVRLGPAALARVLAALAWRSRRAQVEEVLEWRNAVNSVSTRCAGNGCLQRSVAVMVLGAMRGRCPTWCTGFRTAPFLAHAWVEVDGTPVGEPAVVEEYHRVVVVAPRTSHQRGRRNR